MKNNSNEKTLDIKRSVEARSYLESETSKRKDGGKMRVVKRQGIVRDLAGREPFSD